MEYAIQSRRSAEIKSVPLTHDEFVAIEESVKRLRLFNAIEDKFRLMLENYVEFETERAKLAIADMVFIGWNWHRGIEKITHLARRCLNVLNASKMYTDQVESDLDEVFGKGSDQGKSIKAAFAEEYDGNPEYRCCCELRNYAQHSGLPLTGVSTGSSTIFLGDAEYRMEFRLTPHINFPNLQNSRRIKPKVVPEFAALADSDGQIDLSQLMRVYIGCIMNVHKKVRATVDANLVENRSIYRNAMQRFEAVHGEADCIEFVTLDGGWVKSSDMLFRDFIKRTEREPIRGENFRRRFISTRADSDKKIYVEGSGT
jgi:hypothetical protein